MKYFPSEEYLQLSRALEEHHSTFYFLWKIGTPIFSDHVKTLAIQQIFNRLNFLINENYWNNISFYRKKFSICHESVHVLSDHFKRIGKIFSKEEMILANQAADIADNHLLVNSFGFDRKESDPENKGCWTDTMFPEYVEDDLSFEHYLELLKKYPRKNNSTLDDHDLFDLPDLSAINKNIPLNDLNSFFVACTKTITQKQSEEKRKFVWPKFFVKELQKIAKEVGENNLQNCWRTKNRRFFNWNSELILPNEKNKDLKKPKVFIFLDVSASCFHAASEFFELAKTLPESKFDLKLFSFANEVQELDKKKSHIETYIDGTTTFSCIEKFCLNSYPEVVCVFTDGLDMGKKFEPLHPEKWFWFLTDKKLSSIHRNSKWFLI